MLPPRRRIDRDVGFTDAHRIDGRRIAVRRYALATHALEIAGAILQHDVLGPLSTADIDVIL
jgi:hypothetical protein